MGLARKRPTSEKALSTLEIHAKWLYARGRYVVPKRLKRLLFSRIYRDTDREASKSVLVAGTARSGTTWLAQIIDSQIPCRIMFEPFHSRLVEEFSQFHYFPYRRVGEKDETLAAFCRRVFTGDIRHPWIDREVEHMWPKLRLIKAIRANLLLGWIGQRFPEVPMVFIVRHPCAVVLSRLQLGWATDTDIEPFLSQDELVEDYLLDKIEVIHSATSDEEKHAVIWSISNLVPFDNLRSGNSLLIFYEDLYLHPEIEIPRIFAGIKQDYGPSVISSLNKPSTTSTRSSAVVTGEDRIAKWKNTLAAVQVEQILSVVEAFDLGHLYGESVTPLESHN